MPPQIYIRRQSIQLAVAARNYLHKLAEKGGLSTTQYVVKILDDQIKLDPNYDLINTIADQLLAIDPEAHQVGETVRKPHKKPAKGRSEAKISILSVPVPVPLNTKMTLLALAHNTSTQQIMYRLMSDFFAQEMTKRPQLD